MSLPGKPLGKSRAKPVRKRRTPISPRKGESNFDFTVRYLKSWEGTAARPYTVLACMRALARRAKP